MSSDSDSNITIPTTVCLNIPQYGSCPAAAPLTLTKKHNIASSISYNISTIRQSLQLLCFDDIHRHTIAIKQYFIFHFKTGLKYNSIEK